MFNAFIKLCRDNGGNMTEIVGEMGQYIKYINVSDPDSYPDSIESDFYTGNDADNAIFGADDNDTLHGVNGNDVIFGQSGEDKLYGGNETDILTGGTGEDYLYGELGNDTYVFNLGDGRCFIENIEFSDLAKCSINYNEISLDKLTSAIELSIIEDEDTSNISSDSIGSVDTMVDSMTNLVVQEMSEINSDNVINVIDNSANISNDDNVQLWVAE